MPFRCGSLSYQLLTLFGRDVSSLILAYLSEENELLLCGMAVADVAGIEETKEVALVDLRTGEVVLCVEGSQLHDFLVVDVSPISEIARGPKKETRLWAVMPIDSGVYVYDLMDARSWRCFFVCL